MLPAGHQLHQVGAFVLPQRARLDQPQLHRGHLDPLGEVDAVEPVAEAAELEDVVLAGGVVGMGVPVLRRH